MAAWASAADMLFQSVEMVDMRLSTISDYRFRFSLPWRRLNLIRTVIAPMTMKRGKRTAEAVFPWEEEWEVVGAVLLRDMSAAAGTEPELGAE